MLFHQLRASSFGNELLAEIKSNAIVVGNILALNIRLKRFSANQTYHAFNLLFDLSSRDKRQNDLLELCIYYHQYEVDWVRNEVVILIVRMLMTNKVCGNLYYLKPDLKLQAQTIIKNINGEFYSKKTIHYIESTRVIYDYC